jgi:hypothetical protein
MTEALPPLFLVYEGETHHREAERKHPDNQQEETNTRQGVPCLGTFHVLQGIEMNLGLCSVKCLDAENTCLYFNTVHFVFTDSMFIPFFFRDSHSPVHFLFIVLCSVDFVLILSLSSSSSVLS